MSNFVLVVPEGWTQLDLDVCIQAPGVTLLAIQTYIASLALDTLAIELINGGILPAGSIILEAQVFNGETFLVRLG